MADEFEAYASGPTLGFLLTDWIQAHCVVPDRHQMGDPFILTGWQLQNVIDHYEVKPHEVIGDYNRNEPLLASAFRYRRSQTIRPQKAGKGPLTAAVICAEAVGPVLWGGFAYGGEVYDCRDHGCGCGWWYEYEPGEPMGLPWSTPLIQITATSIEQTDNIYDALKPMIDRGPLSELIPKTGEEFIRLPNGGRIDVVTSNARSRLGQRVTFVPWDETGLYTEQTGMIRVAETQRRGLSGMGGRGWEFTNPWDPSEESVAQRTWESVSKDIHKDFPQAPSHLNFKNKADRKKILRYVYAGSPWVNLDNIEAEAMEIMEKDPGQAERFYGNRVVYGMGTWIELEDWHARRDPTRSVPCKTLQSSGAWVGEATEVVLGMDGSDVSDWTVIRAETEDGFQFTPTFGSSNKPCVWNPADYGGQVPRLEVDAAVHELMAKYNVIRFYVDPPYWETEVDRWSSEFGDDKVLRFETYRPVQMHAAAERFVTDVNKQDSDFTHDGCPYVETHVRNTRKAERPQGRYVLGKPANSMKIDGAVSSVLCHEAAGDATAADLWTTTFAVYFA
jgi:hypothetical protein